MATDACGSCAIRGCGTALHGAKAAMDVGAEVLLQRGRDAAAQDVLLVNDGIDVPDAAACASAAKQIGGSDGGSVDAAHQPARGSGGRRVACRGKLNIPRLASSRRRLARRC